VDVVHVLATTPVAAAAPPDGSLPPARRPATGRAALSRIFDNIHQILG
jgi:hypothetical protein